MSALDGPLPHEGLLCVEASAGTGKTHLLSTLAVRWVVEREDVRIADLLIVTYTVAAAAELRDRVRTRLAQVRDRLAGGAATADTYLEALQASADRDGALRRARRALAEFDTASISTIHAFAAAWIGDERGGVGPSEQRRRQAVADVLGAAAFEPGSALFEGRDLRAERFDRVVGLALDHPDLVLAPRDGVDAEPAAFAHRDAVRRAVELFHARGRRDGVRTYADLLTDLAAAIDADDAPVLRALRARYRVGLVDEFQDTDPTQWHLFRRLFLGEPGHVLVVVGDPKQAIYGFRGADVETYLAAREAAADPAAGGLGVDTLEVNYRADGGLVEALNGVLGGSHLDEASRIRYVPVRATDAHRARRLRLRDGSLAVPLSLRVATGTAAIAARRRGVAEACADEAVRALGATVADEVAGRSRTVTEDDVVVLCESATHFPLLREAFLRRGLRTTETRSDDVVTTPAALDVAVALRALRDPGDAGALAAMAHAWFGAQADDEAAIGIARAHLVRWGEALQANGVVALGRAITDPAATRTLLQRRFGERALTDVHHLFDVLANEVSPGAGPTALLEALEAIESAPREGGGDDIRTRRIDTDAPAIRMMSIHGAKGLEFDVVLCPFVQRTRPEDRGAATIWHDDAVGARLCDAGGGEPWTDPALEAPTPEARVALAERAAGSESRRLLYVALTRARHRTVVWWVRAYGNADPQRDELTALLLDRDDAHAPIQRPRVARDGVACYAAHGDEALGSLREHLAPLVDAGLVEVAAVATEGGDDGAVHASVRGLAPVEAIGVATLGRSLAERARRCSFSSLVAPEHDAGPTEDVAVGDARADDEATPADDVAEPAAVATDPGPADAPDPFGGLRGAAFGSAIHEALEVALRRPPTASFEAVAAAALDRALRREGIEPTPVATAGLLAASTVPIAGGPALADLPRGDVATELAFAMPVAAGVDLARVAATIADADEGGPFGTWARTLAEDHGDRPLATLLVGSIDLVTTLGGSGRHHVIDYKTNVVDAAPGFAREGLLASMRAADYPLQAAIYLVALHRLLRWRVPGYDPIEHLGDAHYLYLRGMRPGAPGGVCTWAPGPDAVVALSELLAGAS